MTQLLRLLLSWSVRRVVLFILIVAAMVAFVTIVDAYQRLPALAAEVEGLEEQDRLLAAEIRGQRERAIAAIAEIQGLEHTLLRQRLTNVRSDIVAHESGRARGLGLALSAARGGGHAVAREMAGRFRLQLLRREEAVIVARLASMQRAGHVNGLAQRIRMLDMRIRALEQRIAAIEREHPVLTRIERIPIVRRIQGPWRDLTTAREELASANGERQRLAVVYLSSSVAFGQASRAYLNAQVAVRDLAAPTGELRRLIEEKREQLAGHWSSIVWRAVRPVLGWAAWVMVLVLVTPPAVKAFWFFVLAPLAARLQPIRIGQSGGDIRWAEKHIAGMEVGSAVSKRLFLAPGQELLVRPEFLQSSVADAQTDTQLLLSSRIPFGSLATGLIGLTRVRPTRDTSASVSATKDMIDEVGLLEVAEGSAVVFRPRNLVGVVYPAGRPIQLERVWTLGCAMSWLTLQFRHLVFHGPCALLVKGARGIAIESAAGGRRVRGAATMGWDAGLDYSVTRSETFLAYLNGKQSLFHDRFDGAPGSVIYEEMPRARAKSGLFGRGLEGLGDGLLKIVGL